MKRFTVICVCVLLPMFIFGAADSEADRMNFADGLYAREMYELATKEYEAIQSDFPQSKQMDVIKFRLGESYRHIGKVTDADRCFRDIFIKYTDSQFRFRAGFRRADLHRRAGKTDNALVLYKLLIEDKAPPEIASAATYYIGEIYQEMGKQKEAVVMFEKVRTSYKDQEFYSYALLKLGEIYSKDEEMAGKALEVYTEATGNPASKRLSAESLFQTAELYYRQKQYDKSAEAYKRLMKEFPEDQRSSEAGLQAAWAQYNAGLFADAYRIVEELLKAEEKLEEKQKSVSTAEWLYIKANCERQLLNNDAAVSTYEILLRNFPKSEFADAARYEKALSSYKAGKHLEAISEAEKIRVVPGRNSRMENLRKDVYWLLAESYAAVEKNDDAVQYYRLIAKDFPESDVACDATYRLAYHLQGRGEYIEASRNYGIVAQKYKDSELAPRALFASGVCLAKAENYTEAVRDWSELVRTYPENLLVEDALFQKAMSEIRLDRKETAVATLAQLLNAYSNSRFKSDAYYWRGTLLKEDGKLKDAESELRQALKNNPAGEIKRDAEFQLAVVLYQQGSYDEAANFFQALLATPVSGKFSPALLEWLAGYRIEKGQFDPGLEASNLLIKSFKEDAWQQIGLVLAGRCYRGRGSNGEAEKVLSDALSLKVSTPYAAEAALRLGEIKLADNKLDDAMKNFEKAAEFASGADPSGIRAHAYAGLARAAKSKGDLNAASRYYMSVAILYDDKNLVGECLYEAVRIFRQLNMKDEADKAARELSDRYADSPFVEKLKSGS